MRKNIPNKAALGQIEALRAENRALRGLYHYYNEESERWNFDDEDVPAELLELEKALEEAEKQLVEAFK